MCKVSFTEYDGYGKCCKIAADGKVMLVTCDFGPRIIYCGLENEPNLFYEDREDNISEGGEYFDTRFGKGTKWHIYGGHRLWRSPEDWDSYYPDNSPVAVEVIDGGARFTVKPESETTGLQKIITVKYTGTEFEIEHTFINCGEKTAVCSLWALTVMSKGGTAFYPYTDRNTGLLANRNLVLWSYTDVKDKRLTVANNGIVLRQDPSAEKPIKVGFLNQTGRHYYINGNQMLSVRTEPAAENGNYPDYSSSTETYTNKHMLELETLSELKNLKPGDRASHFEYWNIYGSNASEFAAVKREIETAEKG